MARVKGEDTKVKIAELHEIERQLDKTFKRCAMADGDDETPLVREVYALEEAVRGILGYLNKKDSPR